MEGEDGEEEEKPSKREIEGLASLELAISRVPEELNGVVRSWRTTGSDIRMCHPKHNRSGKLFQQSLRSSEVHSTETVG